MQQVTVQDGESLDVVQENIQQLKELFPEAFTEDGVDFDVLRQLLGDAGVLDEGEEKFGLNWHGKKRARQIALTPSTGTLRPCPEESVDWDTTQNLFIEGDNLEVLKLLQKSYAGRVKMIYIDPPYNTGKEFIYPDNYQDNLDTYLRYTGQKGEDGLKFSSNTESSGRYHTNWLNMMYPRLKLAKSLLCQDGVIFISIDDNELTHLKEICDEIFGEENCRGIVSRPTGTPSGQGYDILVNEIDYILVYAKSALASLGGLPFSDEDKKIYNQEDEDGLYLTRTLRKTGGEDRREDRPTMYYGIEAPNGSLIFPIGPTGYESRWRCGEDAYFKLLSENRIEWKLIDEEWKPYQKFYLEGRSKQPSNLWQGIEGNKKASLTIRNLFDGKVFDTPKPVELVGRCIRISSDFDDLILDFFAGSATTAHAVLKLNVEDGNKRKFIVTQLPEASDEKSEASKLGYKNIADVAKERIRRSAKKIKEENPDYEGDLGFKVFKLDSSNIRAWNPDAGDLEQALYDHIEHLVPGRSEQDVLYELLLKRGVDLATPIESRTVAGKTVYSIGYGVLLACLAPSIARDEVEELASGILAWHEELQPATDTHLFFRDSAFADDVTKTNLSAILHQYGIHHVRSL